MSNWRGIRKEKIPGYFFYHGFPDLLGHALVGPVDHAGVQVGGDLVELLAGT